MIDEIKKSGEWEIHLTIKVNCMSSKDNDDKRLMHPQSDNIEIMIGSKTDEIINELFESLISRYQIFLEMSMKGSEFVFKYVNRLHYKCKVENVGGA